jgi:gas vesicle protein
MHRDEETGRFVRDERDQRRPRATNRPAQYRAAAQSRRQSFRIGGCPDGSGATKTTLGLLAGAGIGAGLMYLMDPYEGPTRRARIADAAGSTWESLSEGAATAGSAIASHLPSASDLRDKGHKFLSRAGDAANETASGWWESARNAMPAMPALPQRRRPTDVSATSATVGGLGLIALSVAATWLFDPQRGRGRRAWLAQKATRYMNETGDFMRATGRHLRNRAKGAYHEGHSAVEDLAARARATTPATTTENCPEGITTPPTSL